MKIVATMSLPAVDRPNDVHWSATCLCQLVGVIDDHPKGGHPPTPNTCLFSGPVEFRPYKPNPIVLAEGH